MKLHYALANVLTCFYHADLVPAPVTPEWVRQSAAGAASQLTNCGCDLNAVQQQLSIMVNGSGDELLAEAEQNTFEWDDEEWRMAFMDVFREMLAAVDFRLKWNRNG